MSASLCIFSLLPVSASAPLQMALSPFVLGIAAVMAAAAVGVWFTVHTRQAREFRASEERFRNLFENAIEGIYENRPEGGFSRANPALARILGYASPGELCRLTPAQTAQIYLSPTRRDEFFTQLGSSDRVANFESEIRRPDGGTAWIKENVRAVRDARGRLLHLQGFVSEITERKRAEDELRASEGRYRLLFDHLPIGVVEYDYSKMAGWLAELRARGVRDFGAWAEAHPVEWRTASHLVSIVGANAATLRLLGLRSFAEGLANLERIYPVGVAEARRQTVAAIWRGAPEASGEFTVIALDGRPLRIFYQWRAPVFDGQPLYDRTQLALIDVTEIQAAHQALAAERERLSVTLRAMSEAVITIAPSGTVQFMNEAAVELTGWPKADAVGCVLDDVCQLGSDQAGRALTAPVAAALSGDRAVDLPPFTLLHPREGTPRRVEGRCAPMHDLGGNVIGVVLVMRDVTQRSRLEADLLRASKMESIGVLAGGIAHDFKNLLAIVMGNLTLALLDERVREAGGKWLREAERGTLRAKDLTHQLLTFAKGGDPVRSAVLLPDIVREAAEFALHGSAVRCEFDLAADLRPADADKGQIGQVVQNLIINAVQAMPAGGSIRLTLCNEVLAAGAVATLPPGDYLRLEISDTGRGIEPEHLPRIFEPFFTTKEDGTGLGLATVYSVIQKHRGSVAVESVVGRGTTFRILLPAARVEPSPVRRASTSIGPLSGRVLFMDDEEPIRTVTKALLQRLGLETTLTSDGGEAVREYAIARISGRPYQAVIVDLTVPGAMGGAEAMREILKIDPDAKGIVSSGYSSDPVMANFRAHGFRASVPKPYQIADFARTLREVLNER